MSDAPTADTSAVSAPVTRSSVDSQARRRRRVRPRSAAGMVLQVVLITLGVFLGLAGEQWREERQGRRVADDALANIDPELAFHLSRTYHYQDVANELGRGVMDAMYTRPPADGDPTFFAVLELYYGDLGGLEPGLLEAYDASITAIDTALAN